MENNVKVCSGLIGAILCFIFGTIDTPILVLIFVICTDYVTGMIKGMLKGKLSSKQGLKGFFKKLVLLMVIAFGCQLDRLIGSEGLIRNFVIYYYIANEGLSIIENCAGIGVPIPSIIKKTLDQMKEGKD